MQLCDFTVGDEAPLFFIAGPCVIETETLILDTASELKKIGDELGVPVILKAPLIKSRSLVNRQLSRAWD